MGYWRIGTDVLAGSRFMVSPLAETVACLLALEGRRSQVSVAQRDWIAEHRPAYLRRRAADPVAGPFVEIGMRPGWNADFVVLPPHGPDETFEEQIVRVRAFPEEPARATIAENFDRPLPAPLLRHDIVDRAADLLEWVWTETLAHDWPRRRRLFQADIVSRTSRLSSGGWAAVIDGMRPGMRWLGESRLQINANDYPPKELTGAQLLFIPVSAARGWVAWEEPRIYAVTYPCSGWLVPSGSASDASAAALERLLGPVRAQVLLHVGSPKSTTQLVALTGYGLGSVGGHLKVLLDAGLVRRRRSGRSVLYYRTPLGDSLVRQG